MSLAIKIMALAFLINISAGILGHYAGLPVEGLDTTKYQGEAEELSSNVGGTLSGPPAEASTNFFERLLDTVSLGVFSKLKGFVQNYLLGVPTLLTRTGIIDSTLAAIISGVFVLVYVIGMIEIWTNRRLLY